MSKQIRRLIALLAVTVGLVPVLLYSLMYDRVPWVTPSQAKAALTLPESPAVLVDLRSLADFNQAHIQGAHHWPYTQIMTITNLNDPNGMPDALRNRSLLLLSEAGLHSVTATRHLQGLGLTEVRNVRGGLQEWIGSVTGPDSGPFDRFESQDNTLSPLPTRVSPMYEKLLAVFTGFGVKYTYMSLALVVAFVLRKSQARDLCALRWSMILFFLGEAACSVNYMVYQEKSYLTEYLHGYGMILAFSWVAYALMEGLDSRLIKLSAPTNPAQPWACAANASNMTPYPVASDGPSYGSSLP